jgi:hypothetical protein
MGREAKRNNRSRRGLDIQAALARGLDLLDRGAPIARDDPEQRVDVSDDGRLLVRYDLARVEALAKRHKVSTADVFSRAIELGMATR